MRFNTTRNKSDTPRNSLKDPNVTPIMKTKKEKSQGMLPNSQHFGG